VVRLTLARVAESHAATAFTQKGASNKYARPFDSVSCKRGKGGNGSPERAGRFLQAQSEASQ